MEKERKRGGMREGGKKKGREEGRKGGKGSWGEEERKIEKNGGEGRAF